MFHVKHRKDKNMLNEIAIYIIILGLVIFIGGVIGYLTLGNSTRFYTRQVLDEVEEYKNNKRGEDHDDTFFNHD